MAIETILISMLLEQEKANPPLSDFFGCVEIEEENDDFDPGYYFSTLTPKEVWEKL